MFKLLLVLITSFTTQSTTQEPTTEPTLYPIMATQLFSQEPTTEPTLYPTYSPMIAGEPGFDTNKTTTDSGFDTDNNNLSNLEISLIVGLSSGCLVITMVGVCVLERYRKKKKNKEQARMLASSPFHTQTSSFNETINLDHENSTLQMVEQEHGVAEKNMDVPNN